MENAIENAFEEIEVYVDKNSYANTFPKNIIDIAAKIVHTGIEIVFKVIEEVWVRIKISEFSRSLIVKL